MVRRSRSYPKRSRSYPFFVWSRACADAMSFASCSTWIRRRSCRRVPPHRPRRPQRAEWAVQQSQGHAAEGKSQARKSRRPPGRERVRQSRARDVPSGGECQCDSVRGLVPHVEPEQVTTSSLLRLVAELPVSGCFGWSSCRSSSRGLDQVVIRGDRSRSSSRASDLATRRPRSSSRGLDQVATRGD